MLTFYRSTSLDSRSSRLTTSGKRRQRRCSFQRLSSKRGQLMWESISHSAYKLSATGTICHCLKMHSDLNVTIRQGVAAINFFCSAYSHGNSMSHLIKQILLLVALLARPPRSPDRTLMTQPGTSNSFLHVCTRIRVNRNITRAVHLQLYSSVPHKSSSS